GQGELADLGWDRAPDDEQPGALGGVDRDQDDRDRDRVRPGLRLAAGAGRRVAAELGERRAAIRAVTVANRAHWLLLDSARDQRALAALAHHLAPRLEVAHERLGELGIELGARAALDLADRDLVGQGAAV